MRQRRPWYRSWPVVALGLVIVVAVLFLAKPVLVPLALAMLLTFVLSPVILAIQGLGFRRVYAVVVTVLLAFAMIGLLGWLVAWQVQQLAAEVPKHRHEIREKIDRLRGAGEGPVGELLKMVQDLTESDATVEARSVPRQGLAQPVVLTQPKESGMSRVLEAILPVVEPLATTGLVIILVVFMLANKEDLRDRLIGLAGHGRLASTTRAMSDAAERVGRYLLSQLAVNLGFGTVFAVGLWVLGIPFAPLWGFLAAVLRFIPYLGSWAAVAFPTVLSIALAPDWTQPLLLLGFFGLLDLLVGQVLEPLVFGHGTGLSPIALLLAAAFWTWIWGPVGLLLSTPLTVCVVVLGQHVPRLGFLAMLLSDAPALSPPARLYQRLLARDEREAAQRLAEYVAQHGSEAAYDEMVVPAVLMARRERQGSGLAPGDEEFVLAALERLVGGLPDSAADSAPAVVACPAHHPAEEPVLSMLAHLLGPDGLPVDALSARSLPSDVVDRVAAARPAAVFIAVLPPGGLPQAAYLCRLLRKRFPALKIVVGWWGSERHFDRLLVKLRKAGADYVTTSLKQARTQLRFVAAAPAPDAPAALGVSS